MTASQAAHDAAVNIFVQILQARENPGTMTEDEVQQMVVDAFAAFEATIRAEQASRPASGDAKTLAAYLEARLLLPDEYMGVVLTRALVAQIAAALSRAEPGVQATQLIAEMMVKYVDNWPDHKRLSTSIALIDKTMKAACDDRKAALSRVGELEDFIANPPRHDFWGAGEPECPRDIKAGNGELHTLRCKRCNQEGPGDGICRAAIAAMGGGE